jgi:hypothetical protein
MFRKEPVITLRCSCVGPPPIPDWVCVRLPQNSSAHCAGSFCRSPIAARHSIPKGSKCPPPIASGRGAPGRSRGTDRRRCRKRGLRDEGHQCDAPRLNNMLGRGWRDRDFDLVTGRSARACPRPAGEVQAAGGWNNSDMCPGRFKVGALCLACTTAGLGNCLWSRYFPAAGAPMGILTSRIFKEPVRCFGCDTPYLFTLEAIAQGGEVRCPGCHTTIELRTGHNKELVTKVQERVRALQR